MQRITRISPLACYGLAVEFEDGVAGTIELEAELFGLVFAPLRNEALFAQVRLDEFGAPCWPTGADLAPDTALYAQFKDGAITQTVTKVKAQPQKPL
jgi:hypothetical protein